MNQFLAIRNGGKTDENAALRFLRRASPNGQGNVQSGDMQVTQNGTPNQSVNIAVGDLVIEYQDYAFYAWIDAILNLAVAANTSGNPRIDAIVAYIDLSVVSSASNNNPGALKFIDVQGTPAGSPVAPNGTAIQAAVGAGNPYFVLANVTLANNYTTIVNANITDLRTQYVIGSTARYGFFVAGVLSVANDQDWNPIAPVSQTLNGILAYCKTAPTTSGLTVQIYNITQAHVVGSVTIAAGANQASTTSLTNPSINAGDVLRVDVTAVGSGTPGNDVSVVGY